jgi:S-adenosylmethionine:tRNA ribosyltransferase-isomerase
VFARAPGAVAAPTAGLHFTSGILAALAGRGVEVCHLTLHVGAGTFQPLREADPTKHRMHPERYHVPEATARAVNAARRAGRPVMAVGTTSLRTLESCARGGELVPGSGETSLYILPGYRFAIVDRLLTNFHLPGTTLLLLACAFGGTEALRAAYGHALAAGYRFFSYGDAMLLERAP